MKNYIKILLAILFVFVIVSVFVYQKKPTILPVSAEIVVGTYVAHLAKDVYTLNVLFQEGESFKGTLDIKNFEKDSSSGTLTGTYKNGILLADYTFQSEGTESVNQVIFKKIGDDFVRGYGNMDATGTRFADLNNITYDMSAIYKKVPSNGATI